MKLHRNGVVCQKRVGPRHRRGDLKRRVQFAAFVARNLRDLQAVDGSLLEILPSRGHQRHRVETCLASKSTRDTCSPSGPTKRGPATLPRARPPEGGQYCITPGARSVKRRDRGGVNMGGRGQVVNKRSLASDKCGGNRRDQKESRSSFSLGSPLTVAQNGLGDRKPLSRKSR